LNTPCLKSKRGVASIIGGVFLILIILSGYAFYVLTNSATNDLQNTIQKVSVLDSEKKQESLTVNYVVPNGSSGIIMYVTNSGSILISIKYIGTIDNDDSNAQYNFMDMDKQALINTMIETNIDPGKSSSYNMDIVGFNPSGTYLIKIISSRGNIFTANYRGVDINQLPFIAVTSASSQGGNQLIISGSRFPNGTSVVTIFRDTQEVSTFPLSISTSTFSQPILTLLPAGNYEASVLYSSEVPPVLTSFEVKPTITLDKSAGAVETVVTISGRGFSQLSPLSAMWDNYKLQFSGSTDNEGTILPEMAFTVPSTTLGTHTITIMDESSNSALQVFVCLGPLDHFTVTTPTGRAIGNQVAGVNFDVKVTAYDANGNVKTDYTGSNTATLSDRSASISPTSLSSGWVNGVWTSSDAIINQKYAGDKITSTDGSPTGSSNTFDVTAPG